MVKDNKLRPEFMEKFNVLERHSETLKSWKLVAKSLTIFFSLVNYFCKLVSN